MLFKKKKQKDEEKDELHTEHGVFSNCIYILRAIRKYRSSLLWFMLLGAFTSSLMQYLWSFIGKFVIDIVQQQAQSADKSLSPLIHLLIIVSIIEIAGMWLNSLAQNRTGNSMIYVRMKLIQERIAKALSMNYETLEDPAMLDRAAKARRATGGNNNGVEGMMWSISVIAEQCILIAVTLSTMMTLNIWLVLIIIVMSFLQYLFFRYTVKKDRREVWDKMGTLWRKIDYMEQTTQDFEYAKDIRLFSMVRWLSKKQHEIHDEKYEFMSKSRNYWMYNSIWTQSLSLIRNGLTYGFLIYSVLYKNLSIGNFTLYLGIAATFSTSLTNFMQRLSQLKERSMQTDDFRSFLEIPDENEDDAIPVPENCGYTFTFENVYFKYRGQEDYTLKNINLTLEAGKRLAVVGLNGAGKTTFIKLLLRLYDVTEGRILLNGTDIRRFKRRDYYKLFAPVFQNVEIFAFPMAENVSMKSPDETDCEKSERCLRLAGMGEKVDELEKGVHTELLKVIDDGGIDLSGGQKQKLALARALYKDSPVIVLDEPTAALDALAEYKMYTDFDKITEGKSAVYISHRLSSTRFCDSIAMFKDGEIFEYGTHDELLAKNGAYAEMFEVQAQYYKEHGEEAAVNV